MSTFARIDDTAKLVNHPPQIGQTRRNTFTGATFAVLDWEENRGPRGVFIVEAPPGAPDAYSPATLADVSTYVSGPASATDADIADARIDRAINLTPHALHTESAHLALSGYVATMIPAGIMPKTWMLGTVLDAISCYAKQSAGKRIGSAESLAAGDALSASAAKPSMGGERIVTMHIPMSATDDGVDTLALLRECAQKIGAKGFGISCRGSAPEYPVPPRGTVTDSLEDLAEPIRLAGTIGTTLDRDALAAEYIVKRGALQEGPKALADMAYAFADAMIAESAKGHPAVTEAQAASYRELAHAMATAGGCPGTSDDLMTTGAAEVIRRLVAERKGRSLDQASDDRLCLVSLRYALKSAVASLRHDGEDDMDVVTRVVEENAAAKANASTLDKIADTLAPVRADGETVLGCIHRVVLNVAADTTDRKRVRELVTVARRELGAAHDRVAPGMIENHLRAASAALAKIPGTTTDDS